MTQESKTDAQTEPAQAGSLDAVVMARCRWCDRNDRPIEAMEIYSYKHSHGGFTGVCKDCMNDPAAEARYHERMLKQGEELSKRHNAELSDERPS